ncbi:MAG: hypothetical protein L0322_25180 [Chloroflexi bacterium]|nr:hypothetical protein [Chloroflexota bacterium]
MKSERYFLAVSVLVLALALGVSFIQAQEPGGGEAAGGPESLEAVVNSRISYQGILKENGVPVTGSRNMVFELYLNGSCSGGPVQSITQNGVSVTNGFFTVDLDVDQSNFDGQGVWLKVVVAGTGLGCEEIQPVPYALSLRPGAVIKAPGGNFAARVENTGSGDGFRSFTNTSAGADWAAVYAFNIGTGSGIWANSTLGYAGYFAGDIFVSGNCTGCLLAYPGVNDSDGPLSVGDLVAVSGVAAPLAGAETPLLRLQPAGSGNAGAIIGVVQSAGRVASSSRDGVQSESVVRADGPAAPGDYRFVVVQGLAQVKVSGPVAAGDALVAAGATAGRATAGDEGVQIGRAVEALVPGSGLVWALVDVR